MAEHPENYGTMLHQIAHNHGCTELAAFDLQNGIEGAKLLYHVPGGGEADQATKQARIRAFIEIIGQCVAAERDGVIRIVENPPPLRTQYCLVMLAKRLGKVVGAAGFIARCHDEPEAKNLLRSIQQEAGRFQKGPPPSDA